MVAREGFRYDALLQQRHTKYGRIRGMVVGEGGRSTGVLLYLVFCFCFFCLGDRLLFIDYFHPFHCILTALFAHSYYILLAQSMIRSI